MEGETTKQKENLSKIFPEAEINYDPTQGAIYLNDYYVDKYGITL